MAPNPTKTAKALKLVLDAWMNIEDCKINYRKLAQEYKGVTSEAIQKRLGRAVEPYGVKVSDLTSKIGSGQASGAAAKRAAEDDVERPAKKVKTKKAPSPSTVLSVENEGGDDGESTAPKSSKNGKAAKKDDKHVVDEA